MSYNDSSEKRDRQFVGSLARGLRVLTAFGPNDWKLSNQEIAERTGLPRPTVSRFVHTLVQLNYLVHHQRLGRFSLSPRVIELGHAAYAATGIRDIAKSAMQALSELGDISVSLGVPSDLAIRYIEMARKPEAIVLNLEVGTLIPIPQTAIGRAYLADLPNDRREQLIERLARTDPDLWTKYEASVMAAISVFETEGFTSSFGEWRPEVNAIATSIHTVEGSDPLLLSIGGLSSILTPTRAREQFAPALMNTARTIQSQMQRLYGE